MVVPFFQVTFVDIFQGVHPQKLTWNLEMVVSDRNLLFQGSIFRFHVCFGGCNSTDDDSDRLKPKTNHL